MSRRMIPGATGLLALSLNAAESQVRDDLRWSVSLGPSMAMYTSRFVPQNGSSFSFNRSEPWIRGGDDGKYNLGLGLSRSIRGSALQWRVDLMYNLAQSAPSPYYTPCDPDTPPPSPFWLCGGPRPALRDEAMTLTAGLQWDAIPASRWSPYLLTNVGVMHSRLQWNTDPTATRPNRTTPSTGPTLGAGLGFRFPLWRYDGFVEMRRDKPRHNVYSSNFVPFSFGIRF